MVDVTNQISISIRLPRPYDIPNPIDTTACIHNFIHFGAFTNLLITSTRKIPITGKIENKRKSNTSTPV